RCKTGRTSSKVRETKSHRIFSQRMHPIHPIGPKTDVLVRFILFGCIRDRLVALRNSEQNGPNKCKSSCHEVVSEFFATNAPDPPHWTLNRGFCAFHTICVHSGPFGCLTKLGAKRAELVQNFVPRSRVGIFRNERTRSNHCTLNWCFGAFRIICVHSGLFGCLTKLVAKRTELVQKFVPRYRVGIFCNECTRSTPLDPNLTFWCISNYLGAFGAAWLPYETRCKTGRTSAKVRATKS